TGPSAEAAPPSLPSYDANKYVDGHYSRGLTEAVTVTVDGLATPAELASLAQRLRGIDGIVGGTPFTPVSANIAFANFTLADRALSSRSQDAVRAVRDLSGPGRIYV